MTFVLCQQVGETNGMAKARIARELMLQSRKRWCNPPLRRVRQLTQRQRVRVVQLQHRRRALSCNRVVYLVRWARKDRSLVSRRAS